MFTQNIAVNSGDEAEESFDEAQERLISPPAVLISEHEVALSTAALRPRPKGRRQWFRVNYVRLVTVQRSLAPSTPQARVARRKYPKHYSFLENAAMAREMSRL